MEIIDDYVCDYAKTQLPNLEKIEQYAKDNYVPICQKCLANFLHFVVSSLKPKRVLEIGTAIGYSGIIMAKANKTTKIDTVELDTDRLFLAKENFKEYNVEKQINAICGDAGDVIFNLEENSYDMIFLDGPKTQYYSYINSLKGLLKQNALLIADNIFQKGMTTGEIEVTHKHKTTICKMLDFVELMSKNKDFVSTILPMGDGVLLATKK